ncbi:MAG: squalene/phytoene synthase family protein [candidate division NC10 bacterium]|nr:squalene/phytoene synthase family protein [candidate division NC10 bacterium]
MAHPPAVPLARLLKSVSRSFYLSLRILPRGPREPVGLAYLFARAADTIADTRVLPRADRLLYLEALRDTFLVDAGSDPARLASALAPHQQNPAERTLLLTLPAALAAYRALPSADRAAVRRVLLAITQGMRMDLTTFPGEEEGQVVALETRADLDRYTYWVAGAAGEFWTDVHLAHRPALAGWDGATMRRRGVRFGRGLQMTNILRDLPRDLRIGRCYLPREDLAALGLAPTDLLEPRVLPKVRPLLVDLLRVTLAHYDEGWAYTLAVPRREWRLRLACAWPLLIGLRTLGLLARAEHLLEPDAVVKVSRGGVYAILARSAARVGSAGALDAYYRALRAGARAAAGLD